MTETQASNIRKWYDALMSGKYKQVRGRLRRRLKGGGYGYCCLGVACKVLGVRMDGREFLPIKATEALFSDMNRDKCDPFLSVNGELRRASCLNDYGANGGKPLNFKQIAAAIKGTYKKAWSKRFLHKSPIIYPSGHYNPVALDDVYYAGQDYTGQED